MHDAHRHITQTVRNTHIYAKIVCLIFNWNLKSQKLGWQLNLHIKKNHLIHQRYSIDNFTNMEAQNTQWWRDGVKEKNRCAVDLSRSPRETRWDRHTARFFQLIVRIQLCDLSISNSDLVVMCSINCKNHAKPPGSMSLLAKLQFTCIHR